MYRRGLLAVLALAGIATFGAGSASAQDKTIKIWRQDENATEQSHPLDWRPTLGRQKF